MEPVGGLVVLRAERLGEPAHEVELAGDGLQLGAVADGDDRTDLGLVPVGGGRAEDEHLLAQHVGLVGHGRALLHRGDQARRQPELVERAALDVVRAARAGDGPRR